MNYSAKFWPIIEIDSRFWHINSSDFGLTVNLDSTSIFQVDSDRPISVQESDISSEITLLPLKRLSIFEPKLGDLNKSAIFLPIIEIDSRVWHITLSDCGLTVNLDSTSIFQVDSDRPISVQESDISSEITLLLLKRRSIFVPKLGDLNYSAIFWPIIEIDSRFWHIDSSDCGLTVNLVPLPPNSFFPWKNPLKLPDMNIILMNFSRKKSELYSPLQISSHPPL